MTSMLHDCRQVQLKRELESRLIGPRRNDLWLLKERLSSFDFDRPIGH